MGKVIVKKTSQSNNFKKLKAHIKYIGFRSQELEKDEETFKIKGGQFFGKYADKANYKSFISGMEKNKALRYGKSVKSHNIVFSLTRSDYEAYKAIGKDYKDLIRDTLRAYEREKGLKLNWIAVEHTVDGKGKSHHPHCHVVIQGVSEPDKEGKVKRIYLKKEDFKSLRENFDKELRKEIGTHTKDIDFDKMYEKSIAGDIGKGFEMITKKVEKEIEKSNREGERIKASNEYRAKKKEEHDRER